MEACIYKTYLPSWLVVLNLSSQKINLPDTLSGSDFPVLENNHASSLAMKLQAQTLLVFQHFKAVASRLKCGLHKNVFYKGKQNIV